jgi:hypothetical protein
MFFKLILGVGKTTPILVKGSFFQTDGRLWESAIKLFFDIFFFLRESAPQTIGI